ncbi:glycosyltransferase family 4 protein [Paenisporosarcina sp.]|uniref:glycosyltransferase family 4 protein n=1 Tax=Paenisporosarcina sp. TaxID=1932001 RepID=UPI003C768561
MKIVQVITRMDTIGGAQVHVRDLSNRLVAEGYEVSIITGERLDSSLEIDQNITYFQSLSLKRAVHPYYDVRAIFEVRQLLKRTKPDLVATHSSKAGLIGRIAARSLGIPTVFTAHGWAFTEGISSEKRMAYITIEKVLGKITDRVITVSNYDRELAISNGVLPNHKIKTIHNGVLPLKKTLPAEDKANSFINILMVARFDVPKRQLDLIQACEKIKHLPWQLSFVGEGTQLTEAKHYVQIHHLQERVRFYGAMKSIESPLRDSQIFVLLSDYEGLPLSILEAMQAGLPIIASEVGGVKESVIDKENGFLIPKQNHEILIKRLTQLISDASLREEMGKRSKELFNEQFTFEKMYFQTTRVYQNVVDIKLKKEKDFCKY